MVVLNVMPVTTNYHLVDHKWSVGQKWSLGQYLGYFLTYRCQWSPFFKEITSVVAILVMMLMNTPDQVCRKDP